MKDKIIFFTLLPKLYFVILFLKQKQTIHIYIYDKSHFDSSKED